MAFLGGLEGLGSIAGGVAQGFPEGLNIDQYLQGARAQNLAGNILGAYGGQGQQVPPLGGFGQTGGGNLFPTADQAPAASQTPMSGLPAGGGVAPVSSQASVPGLDLGQPGVAQGGMSPFAAQQPSLWSPPPAALQQPAQPQGTQPLPQSQYQPPQPSGGQGIGGMGMGQQLTLPQFVQLARQVNPNASGRQIMLAASELGKGGLLGFGGMTPYQAAELQLQLGASARDWEKLRIETERAQSTEQHQRSQERETATREGRIEAGQRVDIAGKALDRAEKQLADAQSEWTRINNIIDKDSLSDEDKKLQAELPTQIRALTAARNRAQKAYDAAEKEYESGGAAAADATGQGEQRANDAAKAKQAIAAGADKAKVLERLKTKYPDFDASELE